MEVISSQQQTSLSVNSIDHGNFSEQVKEEPFDDGDVKNGLFKLEDQNVSAINKELSPTWSLLIERCHLLLTSEKKKSRLDPISITKILVKEVNELLFDIVKFFQECYSLVGHAEEKSNEDLLLEVSGLLINSLPFNSQNLKCCFRLCSEIPKKYLDTLFSPLTEEIDEDDYKEDFYMPLAPDVEIDVIKEEIKEENFEKKSKPGRKAKVKKVHVCDICGKSFKTSKDYKVHVSGVHEKKKPHKCGKCGVAYGYRRSLIHHRNSGKCQDGPNKENKWIRWGKDSTNPKCIHPDCIDKEHDRFTFAGIMNHIIDSHTPDPDDSVSLVSQSVFHTPLLTTHKLHSKILSSLLPKDFTLFALGRP